MERSTGKTMECFVKLMRQHDAETTFTKKKTGPLLTQREWLGEKKNFHRALSGCLMSNYLFKLAQSFVEAASVTRARRIFATPFMPAKFG